MQSIPADIKIHYTAALPLKYTSKLGLGSLALRSIWFYKQTVNHLLKTQKFDLIYFSTTQFPLCILGAYWKRKFKIPYVIDMQDPWHTTYYLSKPKNERPPKHWFSYRLNKWLEPLAIKNVDGLISVSEKYLTDLNTRYPKIMLLPQQTIPFAATRTDFDIAQATTIPFAFNDSRHSILYVGVAGKGMAPAIELLFSALKLLKSENPDYYKKFSFYFIGTSYAPKGKAKKTISPIAEAYGIADRVIEHTDRIGFYTTLKLLTQAQALLIIGTDDPGYTASKLYPYVLANKPLLAILHPQSSAAHIINSCKAGTLITINSPVENACKVIIDYLIAIDTAQYEIKTDWNTFKKYTAEEMTRNQCSLFDTVLQ